MADGADRLAENHTRRADDGPSLRLDCAADRKDPAHFSGRAEHNLETTANVAKVLMLNQLCPELDWKKRCLTES